MRRIEIDLRAIRTSFLQARKSTLQAKTALLKANERAAAMRPNLVGHPFRDALIASNEVQGALSRSHFSLEKKTRKGPRPRLWYLIFVRWRAKPAASIGSDVTTGGDRAGDPASTAFTQLVFAVEELLPHGERSPSLAAGARRIARTIAKCEGIGWEIPRGRTRRKQVGLLSDN